MTRLRVLFVGVFVYLCLPSPVRADIPPGPRPIPPQFDIPQPPIPGPPLPRPDPPVPQPPIPRPLPEPDSLIPTPNPVPTSQPKGTIDPQPQPKGPADPSVWRPVPRPPEPRRTGPFRSCGSGAGIGFAGIGLAWGLMWIGNRYAGRISRRKDDPQG